MNELNKLKVVDFTAGRLSSDDINTDIPFRDNFDKTRTIQQANAVIGAYVNRNYKDMQNKADKDEIPTKLSELENDSGYITSDDIPSIPSKTSELTNDGANGVDPFITADDIPTIPTNTSDLYNDSGYITKSVNDLDNYTNNTDLTTLLSDKANTTDLNNVKSAIDYQSPTQLGTIRVHDIIGKNLLAKSNMCTGIYNISAGAYVNSSDACCTLNMIEINNTKQYTLSTNNTSSSNMYVMYYDSSKNYLGYINTYMSNVELKLHSYTNYSNAKYVNFRFDKPINQITQIQLEEGNTHTTYEEFKGYALTSANIQTDTLLGYSYNFGNMRIICGTVVGNFSSGKYSLNITNLHLKRGVECVIATCESGNYAMRYDFDNSSQISLDFYLLQNGNVASYSGNVRFGIVIFCSTEE